MVFKKKIVKIGAEKVTLTKEKKKDKKTIGTLYGTNGSIGLLLLGSLLAMCCCMECKKVAKDIEEDIEKD